MGIGLRLNILQRLAFCTFILYISSCTHRPIAGEGMIIMQEVQLTFTPKNHALDNNDNFSPDGKFLCYDTRGTVYDGGIGNSQTIEKVDLLTGHETVLYAPQTIVGDHPAPGAAAVSYHPLEDRLIFIHGPFIDEVEARGSYGKRNRTGVSVGGAGQGDIVKLDLRDIEVNRPTIPGAHRGGTHRHEYSRDGRRIGFTYDDFLLPQYGRTIGYMEKHPNAPDDYPCYFAVLLKPVLESQAQPGDIVKAFGDSWVDPRGTQRAFIAKIRHSNGLIFEQDLCVAEIPDSVDIASASSGSAQDYPTPPRGIEIRRLTHTGCASGIVRGSPDGKSIAYFSKDSMGLSQVFTIPADGSDLSETISKLPVQITRLPEGATALRWHPSGQWLFCISSGNIVVSSISTDRKPSESFWLTKDRQVREELVVSPDGQTLAYTIRQSTLDDKENVALDAEHKNFKQIFLMKLDLETLNQSCLGG